LGGWRFGLTAADRSALKGSLKGQLWSRGSQKERTS
jgi:hypothetical protein